MDNTKLSGKYLITLIGCCILIMNVSIMTTGMSFLLKPVSKAMGFTVSSFSIYYSLLTIFGALTMPFWGRFIAKTGVKKSAVISGTMATLALLGLSRCSTLAAFYAVGTFIGLIYVGATLLPAVIIINNWFAKNTATFTGIVFAFTGVGGSILGLVLPSIIGNYGWRNGYLFLGIIYFVLTVPTALFLLRTKPSEAGLTPYGYVNPEQTGETQANSTSEVVLPGMTFRQATKTPQFYLIFISLFLVSAYGALQQYMPAHFVNEGLTAVQAGSLISIISIAMIATKVVFGIGNDKIGVFKNVILFMGFFMLSALLLGVGVKGSYYMAATIVIIWAVGYALIGIFPPVLTNITMGTREFGPIYGIIGAATTVGLSVAMPIWGAIYDKTGSYNLCFYIGFVLLALTLSLFLYCLKTTPKLWKQ